MSLEILFSSPYAEVKFDNDINVIMKVCTGRIPNAHFIPIHQAFLDSFLSLSGCQKFFLDAREIGALSKENQDWLAENLYPRMIDHLNGKKLFHAQVLPQDPYGQLALADIRKAIVHPQLSINGFTDYQQGWEWLLKQETA